MLDNKLGMLRVFREQRVFRREPYIRFAIRIQVAAPIMVESYSREK
jgi:hypothetical protein